MIQPTISYLTDVYFGFGVSDIVPDLLVEIGIRRPLLVTDAGLMDLGIAGRVGLHDAIAFCGVETNPSEAHVLKAREAYRKGRCDGLVAVGGGSSIDLAKCAGILVGHAGSLESYAIRRGGAARVTRRVPPIIAVPTTAGSGSEVGRAALVTLSSGDKVGILSRFLTPAAAVCDPELTLTMPPPLIAGTGMDAISHCVETFCSTRFNPVADAIALDGLERGCRHLCAAYLDGTDREARSEMLMCALQGGLAFQKSLGAVHSLSHPLGSLDRSLHHGTLNGVFLPAVLRFNFDSCAGKFEAMAQRLRLKKGSDLPDYFEALNRRLGVPQSLSELGITREELKPLAAKAAADHCSPTNPRPLDEAACRMLYLSVL
ncbi:MAG: iron-containing alcohol dehydrogenase [Gemmatimonadota bacterium]|nr:iron-containing alcohol dehydrogenase [Gemmatimonadota bacterium]